MGVSCVSCVDIGATASVLHKNLSEPRELQKKTRKTRKPCAKPRTSRGRRQYLASFTANSRGRLADIGGTYKANVLCHNMSARTDTLSFRQIWCIYVVSEAENYAVVGARRIRSPKTRRVFPPADVASAFADMLCTWAIYSLLGRTF